MHTESDRLLANSTYGRLSQVDILENENPSDGWFACIRNQVKHYDGSIVTYSTNFLMNFGWILPFRGSVVSFMTLFWIASGIAAVHHLAKYKCSEHMVEFEYDCIPLPDHMTSLTLGTSALVIQAIFTTSLMWRWKRVRESIAKIIAAHHSLVASLAVHVGDNITTLRAQARSNSLQACTTFLRLINLGHAVIYSKANTYDTGTATNLWADLLKRGLMRPEEEPYMRIVDSPSAVFAWAILQLDKMKKHAIIEDSTKSLSIKQVTVHLEEIIDSCQDVMNESEQQLPYPYIQLVAIVQAVFFIQLIIVCAGVVGTAYVEMNYEGMITGYSTLSCTMLISLCLSNLFRQLSNPFDGGWNDVPQSYYTTKLEKDTKIVFDGLYSAGQQNILKHNRS